MDSTLYDYAADDAAEKLFDAFAVASEIATEDDYAGAFVRAYMDKDGEALATASAGLIARGVFDDDVFQALRVLYAPTTQLSLF